MDREEIMYLAELSRIELNFQDFECFRKKFNNVINYINTLDDLDLEGVEPTIWMESTPMVLREDVAKDGLKKEEILSNAPDQEYGYFKLKKTVD